MNRIAMVAMGILAALTPTSALAQAAAAGQDGSAVPSMQAGGVAVGLFFGCLLLLILALPGSRFMPRGPKHRQQ